MKNIFLISTLLISALSCVADGKKSFRWKLEYDVEHGRSIENMSFAQARNFRRYKKLDSEDKSVWIFINDKTNCEFEYVTTADGRGTSFNFLSPEENCSNEIKSSGW